METSFYVATLGQILTSQQLRAEKKGKTIAIRVMMMMETVTCI